MSLRPSWPLLAALALLALPACAGGRHARRLEGRFELGQPGDTWTRVKPGGADQAWYHGGLSASIYADSNCATRFDDRPLDKLAQAAVYGVATSAPLRTEDRTIDGRDGHLRVVDGRIDGVTVRIGVAVLKKDECVYDLVYMAPPTTFDTGWDAFEQVIGGFRTRGG
ncbi:hypothetical protein L6R53_05730 [Myxococcota bacterium]|nr:hypothetical protein [Myxococcota bacterium]